MVISYCTPLNDLWPLFGVAAFTTAAVIAFLFMLGRMLSKSEFEGMARKELSQLIVAIVISLCVVGLAGISCETARALSANLMSGGDQFTASTEYLQLLIYGKGLPIIQQLWITGFLLKYAQFNIPLTNPFGSLSGKISVNVAASLGQNQLVSVVDFMADTIFAFVAGSLNAQLLLLQLSQAFAITTILPVGMVLRIIPITRKGGSFLIALAFALYVVLPLTYVMDYSIYQQVQPSIMQIANTPHPPLSSFQVSSAIVLILPYFDQLSVIIPQVTMLAIINFAITVSFTDIFANFIDSIE